MGSTSHQLRVAQSVESETWWLLADRLLLIAGWLLIWGIVYWRMEARYRIVEVPGKSETAQVT
jgi:hypothetical protein